VAIAGDPADFTAGRTADGHLTLTNQLTGETDVLRSVEEVIFRTNEGDVTLSIDEASQLSAPATAPAPAEAWAQKQPVPLEAQQAIDPVPAPAAEASAVEPEVETQRPAPSPSSQANKLEPIPVPPPVVASQEPVVPAPSEPGAKVNGTFNSDRLKGTEGSDYVRGLTGNDAVEAGNGNDTIVAGSGNDAVDGGTGTDTAIVFDRSIDWAISQTSEGYIQLKSFKTGEVDLYDNIEWMTFTDGTFSVAELLGRGW